MSSFSKGESKLPMEYNLQFFVDRNAGNSKLLIPTNLQYFASEGGRKTGTYGQERGIAYKALRKAGFSKEESRAYVRYADNHFMGELGLTLDSPTRIPGNRKGH